MIMGSGECSIGPGGTVEILSGPFFSFLVLFPHSLYCTLHFLQGQSTPPDITLSQAFNFLLHPCSSAANQSINLHAWLRLALQIWGVFTLGQLSAFKWCWSMQSAVSVHSWNIQMNPVERIWLASFEASLAQFASENTVWSNQGN